MPKTVYDELVNEITQQERSARRSFSSGPAGNLHYCLRWSQGLTAGLIAFAVEVSPPHSLQQQAVMAIAGNCLKLSRVSGMTIESGYSMQAMPLVRAQFERIGMMYRVRRDKGLAARLLNNDLKNAEALGFVPDWQRDVQPLMAAFAALTSEGAESGPYFSSLAGQIGGLYGMLSNYVHPRREALPLYFRVDQERGKAMSNFLPEEAAGPQTVVVLYFVCLMQFFVKMILCVDYYVEGNEAWPKLIAETLGWIGYFAKRAPEAEKAADVIKRNEKLSNEQA